MSKKVILSYGLTKELWQLFYEAHYAADTSLRGRYVWGGICIVISCLGFGGIYDSPLIASLLMVTGFYGVLSKPIFTLRSVRKSTRHPFYGRELTVAITVDEIAVRSGTAGYSQPWSNFIGYRDVTPGFIFYLERNSFFFVPKAAMGGDVEEDFRQIIEGVGIERL
jgi:hypothetical protein